MRSHGRLQPGSQSGELALSELLDFSPELGQQRLDRAAGDRCHESGHFLVDHRVDRRDLVAAFGPPGLGEAVEVVHVEERHAGDVGSGGIDVAGDGDVHDQQRPVGTDRHEIGELDLSDHEARGSGSGEQDIGSSDADGEIIERDGATRDPPGQHLGPVDTPVADDDLLGTGITESDGHALAHLSGAEDADRASLERTETVGGHCDRGSGHRGDAAADPGAGPYLAPRRRRGREQRDEAGSDGTGLACDLEGAPHLAVHFGLAQDRRVDPASDREKVPRRCLVVMDVEMIGKVVEGKPGVTLEHVAYVGEGRMEPLGAAVDLETIAGRHHYTLGQIG